MPQPPGTEFWRDIKPIDNVFRPDALPEVYRSKVAEGDERYFVPLSETVGSKPLARPLGGVVFGHFGDRIGRKSVLMASMLLMGIATAAIGCLPSFQQIGLWVPALLVTLRFLQGFALGGESVGAVLLTVEGSPAGKRGLFGGLIQAAGPASVVLASLATAAVCATAGRPTALVGMAAAVSGQSGAGGGWPLCAGTRVRNGHFHRGGKEAAVTASAAVRGPRSFPQTGADHPAALDGGDRVLLPDGHVLAGVWGEARYREVRVE